MKNWSLIYRDPRAPTLSPAYDLVSTAPYRLYDGQEDLGLRFFGSKRFGTVTTASFARIEKRLGATGANLAEHVVHLVDEVRRHWPEHSAHLTNQSLRDGVTQSMETHRLTLLGASA